MYRICFVWNWSITSFGEWEAIGAAIFNLNLLTNRTQQKGFYLYKLSEVHVVLHSNGWTKDIWQIFRFLNSRYREPNPSSFLSIISDLLYLWVYRICCNPGSHWKCLNWKKRVSCVPSTACFYRVKFSNCFILSLMLLLGSHYLSVFLVWCIIYKL